MRLTFSSYTGLKIDSSYYSQLQLALDIGLAGNAFIVRAEKRTNNAHFNIEHLVKISSVLDVEIFRFFE